MGPTTWKTRVLPVARAPGAPVTTRCNDPRSGADYATASWTTG